MRYPDAGALADLVDAQPLPEFARLRYEPPTPQVADLVGATEDAMIALAGDLPEGSVVALGVGSRGITRIEAITEAAVAWCRDRGLAPRIIPAMGSHGGGTAEGQRAVLAELGIEEGALGCPVDAGMATTTVGEAAVGGHRIEIPFAESARSADAVIPINRVAPHTSFAGRVESGICKMLAVGFGKREGARVLHRYARSVGFEPTLEAMLAEIREAVSVPGGIAIVENPDQEPCEILPVTGRPLIDQEAPVLARARAHVKALPFDTVDLLIVDEMGKDVAGTGMDPNVIGRGKADPAGRLPRIERMYVRGLTTATQGNANGVGFADAVHRELAEAVDVRSTYANVLTSGFPEKAALPLVMPTDELAVHALLGSLGVVATEELRIAWIRTTADLSPMWASAALVEEMDHPDVDVSGRVSVRFSDGSLERTREDS